MTRRDARSIAHALAWLAGLGAVLLLPSPARAGDPFEIQVYDGTANPAGAPGIEVHMNHVARGLREAEGGALPSDRQTHVTVEPSFGLTSWWEAGAYLQSAVRKDGGFDYAGAKLRSKWVTPQEIAGHLRLGFNVELGALPVAYDPDRYGTEARPIVAWESSDWLFALNPNVATSLAGDGWRDGPGFEPAAMAILKLRETIGFGFEYYGGFGPIAHPLPWGEQEHVVYEVFHLLSEENVELTGGVGEGLTGASDRLTFKVIVGYTFDLARSQDGSSPPPLAAPSARLLPSDALSGGSRHR